MTGSPATLLYDGECGLCSRGVLFVYARDPEGRFRFASLQSGVGKGLLARHGLPEDLSTLVLVDEAGAHVRSTAALRVARGLGWPWRAAVALLLVPRPLRDWAYRVVAKHRKKLGPAVEACRVPSPGLRARMLE